MTHYRSSRVPRTFGLGDFRADIRLSSDDTGGACEVIEFSGVLSCAASPMHYHERADELVYVIEGRLHVRLSAKSFVAEPGSAIFIKRGAVHQLSSEGPVRVLVTHTPGVGAHELIKSVHEQLRSGEIDLQDLQSIGARYDYHQLN